MNELEKHVKGWNIMREVELIESAEAELSRTIDAWHSKGLSYWCILKIFIGFLRTLAMKSEAEYYINLDK